MAERRKRFTMLDAQELARLHPKTFEAPSQGDLATLKPGDFVKICVEVIKEDGAPGRGERFWVRLTKVGETLTGTIDNELLFTDLHGLVLRDEISFERRHVYNFMC